MAGGRWMIGVAAALAAMLVVVAAAIGGAWMVTRRIARAAPPPVVVPAPPRPQERPIVLTHRQSALGHDVEGEVADATGASRLVRFDVPADTVQLDVVAHAEDGDVDLRAVSAATPPDKDADWTWSARGESGRAALSLTRHAEPDLAAGPFLVEVRPAEPHARGRDEDVPEIRFRLRADAVALGAPREIAAGQAVDAATSPERGHRCDFVVDVPGGAEVLRIDVVDADRDLDLLASDAAPPLQPEAAEWKAASAVARESLFFGPAGGALPRGRLWFTVVDPSLYDAPVRFRVAVTAGADPPAEALALPDLPRPADPRELAIASVVEVIVEDGEGSGTLVSADGLVLTAHHVVAEPRVGHRDITVALDLDPTRIPRDLFHAEVVSYDEGLDLALLRITSGLYGQPLPKGYRFPACPVAFDAAPRLGDPLATIGFPEPAGTGTRAPVMLSKGVVSGFERERAGLRIKTDAFVASGSSGGAALDERWRLVGVPVFTISESDGTSKTGFLVPVSEVPAAWRARIAR